MHDLHLRHLVRRGQQVVHEALRHQLAFAVEGEFLQQRRADAVGDAAERHAAHDVRIDDGAAVVADDVAADVRLADLRVDRHQHHVELEGEAGIHLHAAVRRGQRAAGRHLHDVADREAGLHAGRDQMHVAVREVDDVEPFDRAAGSRVLHAAVAIAHACRRDAQAVRADSDQLGRAARSQRDAPRRPA